MTEPQKIFAKGIFFNNPSEKAPDFVKGNISINTVEFIEFLKANDSNGKVKLDVLLSQKGTMYMVLNNWRPPVK